MGKRLMAFHPMAAWYSRDARMYALVLLLAPAVTVMFFQLHEYKRQRGGPKLTLLLALGFLTHYFFLLIAAILSGWAFLDRTFCQWFFTSWDWRDGELARCTTR